MGLHWPELLALAVIGLLLFGPKRLPEMGSAVGKAIREFQNSMREVTNPDTTSSFTSNQTPPQATLPEQPQATLPEQRASAESVPAQPAIEPIEAEATTVSEEPGQDVQSVSTTEASATETEEVAATAETERASS